MFSSNLDHYLDMHQERLRQSQVGQLLDTRSSKRTPFWQRSVAWLRLFLA